MISKAVYLVVFLAGLALAVHSMLHGVERWRRKRSGKPSPVLNPPAVAALLAGIGACGYLLVTRSSLGSIAVLLISLLVGGVALLGMITLMAKWALRSPANPIPSEEEEVHGQVAVVSRTITPRESGEITYQAWGATHVVPAQSLDGSTIPEGTEVVIELVEDGVAKVELWSVVEQRL
jgi:hypothetical protein